MSFKKIGVLFDFDGTLADSLSGAYQGVVNVCRCSGIVPPSFTQFLRTFQAPYEVCYRCLGVTASRKKIWQWYEEAANHRKAHLFPDVHGTLEHLRRDHDALVGIVTTRQERPVRIACEESGINRHISYLVGGVENKTDALVRFCQITGIAREHVWFVGDFPSDMRDGRAAGVRCLGITRGNPVADLLLMAGAEECIEHLDELPEVVCCC